LLQNQLDCFFEFDWIAIKWGKLFLCGVNIPMHFGGFAQEYFHRHINGVLLIWIFGLLLIVQLQLTVLSGVSDDRIRTALALTHLGKTI
jgi:hypothetical protein